MCVAGASLVDSTAPMAKSECKASASAAPGSSSVIGQLFIIHKVRKHRLHAAVGAQCCFCNSSNCRTVKCAAIVEQATMILLAAQTRDNSVF